MRFQESRGPNGPRQTRLGWRDRAKRLVSTVAAVALLGSGAVTGGIIAAATPAQAAPGTPGTPQAGSVVYAEDFESNSDDAPVLLTDYVGHAPLSQKYTADAEWLADCNGNVLTFGTADLQASNCNSETNLSNVRQLAYALGEHRGATEPASNHAVTAYTEKSVTGADKIEFATVTPITLATASGRFLTFSVDTAAVNCWASAPLYQFNFMSGETATPVGGLVDACTSTTTVDVPAVGNLGARTVPVGTYTADGSLLFDGSALGIRMTNANGSGVGNDAAFDNIQILDVTPQLDKAFTPDSVPVDDQSTLTFTVTNTDELASKNGWAFSDALPAGLTIAGQAATTCPSGVVTATVGSATLEAMGNLDAGMESCTISVPVTSSIAGSYTNGPDNVSVRGLNEPGEATVTFVEPPRWTCDQYGYLFQTPTNDEHPVYQIDLATGESNVIGELPLYVNAVGYNTLDNYFYGWSNEGRLIRIHKDLSVTDLGAPAGTAPGSIVADFDDAGHYWALGGPGWLELDLAPGSPTYGEVINSGPTSAPVGLTGGADWAWTNGLLYRVMTDGANPARLVKFDPATGDHTDLGALGISDAILTGASYVDAQGYLYISDNNTGVIYRIDTATKATIKLSDGPSSRLNDGARCASAPIPTITVTKDVAGRFATNDQFTVGLQNSAGASLTEATTSGAATTVSTVDWPVSQGKPYTLTDAMAPASTNTIGAYIGSAVCTSKQSGDTTPLPGNGPTWDFTVPSGDEYDCVITNTPNTPKFTVSKQVSSSSAWPGDTLTYTVTVDNPGDVPFTADNPASFTDDLVDVLDDATYNGDASNGATLTDGKLSWSGPLAANASVSITYTVTVNSPITGDQSLVNSVVPGTGGSCVAAADCTTTTDVPSFTVVKSSTATEVVAGATVPYTITVTNTGKVAYTAERPALFTDDLSAVLDDAAYNNDADQGATYAAPTLSWSGALAVGESKTIAYSVSVNDPLTGDQQLDNAVVTPPNSGGDCPVNTENANCVSEIPGKSFTVEKKASATSVVPGEKVTYTVTVKNTGKKAFTEDAPASFSDDLAKVLDDAAYNDDVSNGAVVEGAKLSWSGALALGESKSFTYSVTVNKPATGDGVLTNAVVPTSPGGECATVGGCETETGVQSYTVAKSSAPAGAVNPGEKVTYTVTVANTGTVDYTTEDPASFSDDLAKVLDDATYSDDADNGAVVADGKLSWSGAVNAGATVTITYSVTVNNPDLGDHVLENAAVPNGPGGVCATDCESVVNPVRGYTVAKKASTATALPGEKVTYTVTVTNTGAVDYTAEDPASFSDDLAAVLDDATYDDDADNGAVVADGTLSWTGALEIGKSVEVTYSVTVNNPLTGDRKLRNTVVPTGAGGACNAAQDCTTLTEVPSFTVLKEASTATTTPGEAVTYTVTVTNTGAVAYTAGNPASFTDNLADVLDDASYNNDATEGATYKAPVLSWTGALALDETKTITYSVTVNNPITGDHVLRNTVVTPVDGGCAAGSDVPACGTETPVAAYKLVKSVDTANTIPGDKVTYTITVSNIGAVAYTGNNQAAFTDDLSNVLDDATYNNDASNGATYAAPVLSWKGDLDVGETQVVSYSATVNAPKTGDGKLENTVVSTVPGGTCEAGTTNPECSTTVPGPNLEIVKTASADTAIPGDKITYTITVKNTGEGDFTEEKPASFTDDLSAVLDDASYNGDITNGATYAAPVLSWNGALASGEAKTFTYSVTVNSPASGDRTLRNVVTTPPTVPSNCLAESTDANCTTTTKVSTFEVAKTVSAETAKPGDTITYTVNVTNTGQLPYTDENPAGFNDDLTKVLDDATYNGDASNGAVVKDGMLSWTGALELGETKTITYTVTVNSPATGDRAMTNTAIPNGPGGACAIVDCPAVNTLVSSFEVAKTSSSKNATGGDKVSYSITVTNTGQIDYTSENPASFTDDMSKVLAHAAFNNDASNGAILTGKSLAWAGPLEIGKSTTITYSVTVNKVTQGTELVNVVVAPADSGALCQSGATSPDCSTTTVVDPPKPATPAKPLASTGTTIGLGILGLALALVAAGGTLMLTRRNRSRQS